MQKFAVDSGKSKGQFYTPSEVSTIMADLLQIDNTTSRDTTVYDPTCGSGSLLLKVSSKSKKGLSVYGQESVTATAGLAQMNMILHGDVEAIIRQGNTLASPQFLDNDTTLKRFDYVVANPPFSDKDWSSGINENDDIFNRFEDGIPPNKNGDYAFLLHILKSLKSTGKGAVILPHGVLFRGNAEDVIRRNILNKGYIKGIIGLPANLFYGTGIPACIILLDKENAETRKDIFIIDASKGFVKDGNKNRLRHQDIKKIVDTFLNQIDIPKFSKLVSLEEIKNNDFNLNLPRYIDTSTKEDIQDINAHLNGGIPEQDLNELDNYWKVFSNLRKELLSSASVDQYFNLNVDKQDIPNLIKNNEEFKDYKQSVLGVFNSWKDFSKNTLSSITKGDNPKDIIKTISQDLLAKFSIVKLVDKYNVYQILMQYYQDILQDDLYMIAQNGYKADLQEVIVKGKVKKDEWKSDLLPKKIVIKKYFSKEQKDIDNLAQKANTLQATIEDLVQENTGDEGAFAETKSDSDSITKGLLNSTIKKYKDSADFVKEYEILLDYQDLTKQKQALEKQAKQLEKDLDKTLFTKYQNLTTEEVKDLVVEFNTDRGLVRAVNGVTFDVSKGSRGTGGRVPNRQSLWPPRHPHRCRGLIPHRHVRPRPLLLPPAQSRQRRRRAGFTPRRSALHGFEDARRNYGRRL